MRKLDKAYIEISQKYKNNPDNISKDLKEVEEKLADKKELLGKLTETAPVELVNSTKKEINELEAKVTNLKGYSKYGEQINSIQKVKDGIQSKLANKQALQKETLASVKNLKANLKDIKEKLADTKYTETLTNAEYNKLLEDKEETAKMLIEQQKLLEENKKAILNLQGKVGKCDLAWRTLFTNKDWDEVQARAASADRFTRKLDEKDIPLVTKSEPFIEELSRRDKIVRKMQDIVGIERIEDDEPEQVLPPAKLTWFDKVKNAFRNMKEKIFGKKEEVEPILTKPEENTAKSERDEFLEGLRKYADKDYRVEKANELSEKQQLAHKNQKQEENEIEI